MVDDRPPQDKGQTMKPFDLKKALAGEPVVLRDGHKAIVYYCVPDEIKLDDEGTPVSFPLKGMKFDQDGYLLNSSIEWRKDGRFRCSESDSDIVGMWEEPKLTSEQVLEKAYNENLLVLCDGNPDLPLKVIAKTKDGEFVMQPEDDTIQPWIANLTMEWFFVKDPDPKLDTITNTIALPKPFKPKDGELFYYIYCGKIYCDHEYSENSSSYKSFSQNGQCFRTKEDAHKWIDFMKSMME